MTRPLWPRVGHVDPLEGFRGLAAIDANAWVAGSDPLADARQHRFALGLGSLWVGPLPGETFDASTPGVALGNNELLALAAGAGWLVPFVTLTPQVLDELPRWAADGARGVRLLPGLGQPQPLERWRESARRSADLGLVVHVVARTSDVRVRRWAERDMTTDEVADLCAVAPDRTLVSGLNLAAIQDVVRRFPASRPLFDTWFVNGPTAPLRLAEAEGLGDVLCFGTQVPLQSRCATALQLAVADIAEATRHAIARGNASALLARAQRPHERMEMA